MLLSIRIRPILLLFRFKYFFLLRSGLQYLFCLYV
jgi:hypothetical protein